MIGRRAVLASLAGALVANGARPGTFEPLAAELLRSINVARRAQGVAAVAAETRLARAAQGHAEDLARRGILDHAGADGRRLRDRLVEVDYPWRAAAENIATGSDDPDKIVRLWMDSAGHRRNLLRADLYDAGVGVAAGREFFWVLDLART